MTWGDTFKTPYSSYSGGGEAFSGSAASGSTGTTGTGTTSTLGYISGGMNIASGFVKYEAYRKAASGLHDDYKELMRRALQAMEQGWQTAMDIRREGAEVLGEQSAVFGKSGTTMEGSPLFVEADTKRKIELNAQRAIEQAYLEFIALRYQAKKAKKQASGMAKAANLVLGQAIGNVVGGIVGAGAGIGGLSGGQGFMAGSQLFGG